MFDFDLNRLSSIFLYNPKEPLIFSSGLFLFLFTAFLLVYSIIHKNHRTKVYFVTAFSLYFYYKSSGIYFLLLVLTTLVDFTLAKLIYKTENQVEFSIGKSKIHLTLTDRAVSVWRNIFLISSLSFNLGILIYFKYTNFFYEIYTQFTSQKFEAFDIFLPVGVSFFTFQSLSYTLDVYRRHLKPLDKPIDYAFFVSFFPQLVAGPIVRASDFIAQINKPTIVTKEMIGRGMFLICIGLIKKAIIADYISINYVDRIFDNPTLYSGFENLIGVYGYALQIYCDFSGYSDMAIGIALLVGYHFNINFDSPYQSINITEFWRRWHISLSSWLRDYLYISLGGNRKGTFRTYINLFLTMLLGGLWHGAAIRFVIWGALHGLALIIHKLFMSLFKYKIKNIFARKSLNVFSWLLTFHFVCFCWIFFRAENMQTVGQVLNQIAFAFNGQIFMEFVEGYPVVLTLLCLGFIFHFTPLSFELSMEKILTRSHLLVQAVILVLVIILVVQFRSSDIQPFIYFQF
jgi:D-alanyl-lipoteichoic acid acyltransferase DltB (MBOAT superfamily)